MQFHCLGGQTMKYIIILLALSLNGCGKYYAVEESTTCEKYSPVKYKCKIWQFWEPEVLAICDNEADCRKICLEDRQKEHK